MCETAVFQTTNDGAADTVPMAVVSALAAVDGVDPLDVGAPLAEYIDPDALSSLFGSDGESPRDLELSFTMDGCDVFVTSPGTVRVTRPCDAPTRCTPEVQNA